MNRDAPHSQTPQLRDITGIEKPPHAPSTPVSDSLPIVLGLALAIVFFAVLRRWLTTRTAAPDPSQQLLRALERLDRLDVGALGSERERIVQVSSLLRSYLETRLGLPATCRTKEEVLAELPAPLAQSPEFRAAVERVLSVSDAAAFGNAPPSYQEWREAAELVRFIVRSTGQARVAAVPGLPMGGPGDTGEAARRRGPAEGGPAG